MQFEKLDMKTVNFTDENIAKIAEIFPNVVSEDGNGKVIDFDALKQELSANIVEGYKERYSLNWPGKRQAQLTANTPTTKTLRPCKEESVDFDTTENLYIEGDNLEVLKILQESYLNKIKMIYIDPPYNTGNDFIYNDTFKKDSEKELIESGQIDKEGGRLVANPDSYGRYHSDWLSMMYPRLKLARNLLKEEGVIFISIDDNEAHNLRKLCDEVFGEENVETYIWYLNDSSEGSFVKTPSNTVRNEHEYIIACFKSKNFKQLGKYLDYRYKGRTDFTNSDNDPRGNWMSGNISRNGIKTTTGSKYFTITTPTGVEYSRNWTISYEEYLNLMKDNRLYFSNDGDGVPRLKIFQNEPQENVQSSLFQGLRSSSTGKKEVSECFNDTELFQFPKPTKLIQRLLTISNSKEEIVLDFFSGSGSTAHAIIKQNVEDNGNRKFIMVQLPEETDEKSEAYKAGYKTIPEIGKERIRRAGKQIVEESGKTDLDIGFRVLKLDSSNMKDIYFNPSEISQDNLFDTVDNIKDARSDMDLLFGVLIDWGVDLTLPIVKESIAGKDCYFVDEDSLCACFAKEINEEFIKELASREMLRVVFRDSGFASDDVKDNVSQIFKQLNPTVEIKVI